MGVTDERSDGERDQSRGTAAVSAAMVSTPKSASRCSARIMEASEAR